MVYTYYFRVQWDKILTDTPVRMSSVCKYMSKRPCSLSDWFLRGLSGSTSSFWHSLNCWSRGNALGTQPLWGVQEKISRFLGQILRRPDAIIKLDIKCAVWNVTSIADIGFKKYMLKSAGNFDHIYYTNS
jgi:hypothetical protein